MRMTIKRLSIGIDAQMIQTLTSIADHMNDNEPSPVEFYVRKTIDIGGKVVFGSQSRVPDSTARSRKYIRTTPTMTTLWLKLAIVHVVELLISKS